MKPLRTPRIETPGPRPLWTPRPIALPASGLSLHYETQLCDRHGRVERVLQRGSNTITNWGMDQLASQSIYTLVNYLNLSSTSDTRKRVKPGGNDLTVTYTSPTNISVVAASGFFEAADAGRTLALLNVPELKITTFTSTTQVTCQTPSGLWLPGFTPPAPTVYTAATIYYTNVNILATHFTKFNTYATGGQTETTDNSNSRFIHQRIYLSATVTGADWTVNQLGWSDGNAGNNCFGVVNLGSADVIPVGKRYRVILNCYSKYTPIDLTGVAVNWGATIGSYTMDIKQIYIGQDNTGNNGIHSILQPYADTGLSGGFGRPFQAAYRTSAYTMESVYWQGQSGGTPPSTAWSQLSPAQQMTLGAYTAGQFYRTKNIRWIDAQAITAATALAVQTGVAEALLVLRPQTGTVTKPSGYWCDATFGIFWTRDLPP